MNFDPLKTGFVQSGAAKIAAQLALDARVQEKLKGIADEETKRKVLHEKAASTFLGWLLIVLGLLLIVADLGGLAFSFYKQWVTDKTGWLFLVIALSPCALGVCFLIVGGSQISNELREAVGWFALTVKSFVSIFRKLPNVAPPAP